MEIRNKLLKKEILKQLYFNKFFSIAALSTSLNKSIPIILKVINELIKEGLVVETGFAPSTGGRRAVMYSLKPGLQYIIAVAMDQFVTRIAVMDTSNALVGSVAKFEIPLAKNADALPELITHIQQVIRESAIAKEKIIGIGIGMPGFIDARKGLNYSFLESDNKSICDII